MNLRDLEYFVKVAELKHFGKAAEASFVSQPTLSMQIKKLEQELGVLLFHREDKKVTLTEAGAILLTRAQAVIHTAKEIRYTAKTLQDPFALPFRLGVIPTVAPYYLPTILPALQQALPKLKLVLLEEKTAELLIQLNENKIDAALLALPLKHSFEEKILKTENFVAALPLNHPLAEKEQLDLPELERENLLMLEEGHCLRDHALQFCQHFNRESETYRATSLETLCQMVSLGHGITLLPEYAATQRANLTIRPIRAPTPHREIGLVWKKESPRLNLIQSMIEIFLNPIPEIHQPH